MQSNRYCHPPLPQINTCIHTHTHTCYVGGDECSFCLVNFDENVSVCVCVCVCVCVDGCMCMCKEEDKDKDEVQERRERGTKSI
jgi:hypothetical protein